MRELTDNDLLNIESRGSPTPEEMEELIRAYREDRDPDDALGHLEAELAGAEERIKELEDDLAAERQRFDDYAAQVRKWACDPAPETARG